MLYSAQLSRFFFVFFILLHLNIRLVHAVLQFPLIGPSGERVYCAGTVKQVGYTPDGKIATAGGIGVLIWDAKTGDLLQWIGQSSYHNEDVISFSFSPDGKWILTGSEDQSARLWSMDTGKEIHAFWGLYAPVITAQFSQDGNQIILAGGKTIQVYQSNTFGLLRTISLESPLTHALVVPGADEIYLIRLGQNYQRIVEARNLSAGSSIPLEEFFTQIDASSIAVSPDGKKVALGDTWGSVYVWDRESKKVLHTLSDHHSQVHFMAFSSNSSRLTTSGQDESIKVWNVDTGKLISSMFRANVGNVAFSPDNLSVLDVDNHHVVRQWDAQTKKSTLQLDRLTAASMAIVTPDSRHLIVGDRALSQWDLETNQVVQRFSQNTQSHTIYGISIDGKRILTGDLFNCIVRDTETMEAIQSFYIQGEIVRSAILSPNGKTVVINTDRHTWAWNVESGDILYQLPDNLNYSYQNNYSRAEFNSSGKEFITITYDGHIFVWLTQLGFQSREFKLQDVQSSLGLYISLSPDNHSLLGSTGESIYLWDAFNGSLKATFSGHQYQTLFSDFSPDGMKVVSGGADHLIRIWDIDSKKERHRFAGHTNNVSMVHYTPDGKKIVSAGWDGTVRLWDIPQSRIEEWAEY